MKTFCCTAPRLSFNMWYLGGNETATIMKVERAHCLNCGGALTFDFEEGCPVVHGMSNEAELVVKVHIQKVTVQ